MKFSIAAILAILVIAPTGWAQSAVGTWTGETSGSAGLAVRPLTLIIAPDGKGTMTVGSVQEGQADETQEVIDLEVDGNNVSFGYRPKIFGQPANFLFRYSGTFDPDKMTLFVAFDRGNGVEPASSDEPLVLTRQ